MKKILIGAMVLLYFTITSFAMGTIRRTSEYKIEFKRALDAATDAAINYKTYEHDENLQGLAFGYGVGYEHKNNIPVYKDESLEWFYEVLYRNIGIEHNSAAQEHIKQYLPMKCLILFDRIEIADADDQWIAEEYFIIEHNGEPYLFTLSDEVKRVSSGEWTKASTLGIEESQRKRLVTEFIINEINKFLYEHSNPDVYFEINIGHEETDSIVSSINGVNFIVFVDKLPLNSFNYFNPKERFTVFSIGGSELYRE